MSYLHRRNASELAAAYERALHLWNYDETLAYPAIATKCHLGAMELRAWLVQAFIDGRSKRAVPARRERAA